VPVCPILDAETEEGELRRQLAGFWPFVVAVLFLVGPLLAQPARPSQVVFVCQHGVVKSLIATEWFNRLAKERNLTVRAVSRGVEPGEAVPAAVKEGLKQDGFDVGSFKPKELTKADFAGAIEVVALGVESPLFGDAPVAVERWKDIPPATTQYAASRDVMRQRIEALLKKLSAQKTK
jgi:arsenate reductase (thioredoxin)